MTKLIASAIFQQVAIVIQPRQTTNQDKEHETRNYTPPHHLKLIKVETLSSKNKKQEATITQKMTNNFIIKNEKTGKQQQPSTRKWSKLKQHH